METGFHPELHHNQQGHLTASGIGSVGDCKLWAWVSGDKGEPANTTSCRKNWTSTEEMGFVFGSLLFPGDYETISRLICSASAFEVFEMATAEYPEAIRLRRELEKSRKKSSFKDADFRHGSLLQNIMEALSKDIDIRLRTETEKVINRFILGGTPLKDLLAYLSHHFGLLRYLPALLSSRQDAHGSSSPSDNHASQACCENHPEQQAREHIHHAQEVTEHPPKAQRKILKAKGKSKASKDREAEKRELEPLECLNCGVRWAPMPRQGMCNACGIYAANNKRSRPLALAHKLMKSEPWKFSPETPPGHVLKTKDNGKTVAVPLEDFEASLQADDNIDSQPDSRPTSAVAMTTDEDDEAAAEAVRRSNRSRRPPAHLSSDDDYFGSDGELPSGDEKLPRHPNNFTNWPGINRNLSDDSDQSCFEDEDMYEPRSPLGEEEVKVMYSHTSWQSPQDDSFAAESLLYLRHSRTPVKSRKRMYEAIEQEEEFPAKEDHIMGTGFMQAPAEPLQAVQAAAKKQKEKRKPKLGGPCTNCGTDVSSMWRPHNSKFKAGPTRCNACGIYVTSYGMERPVDQFGNLDKAAAKRVSSSRANSRKRICRENSTGSDFTGQGLVPSQSGSLPASSAPYKPVPSAFAPKAATGAVFNISVDASGGAQLNPAMLFEHSNSPIHRINHLNRQISAAGSGTLQRALFVMEKAATQSVPQAFAPSALAQQ